MDTPTPREGELLDLRPQKIIAAHVPSLPAQEGAGD